MFTLCNFRLITYYTLNNLPGVARGITGYPRGTLRQPWAYLRALGHQRAPLHTLTWTPQGTLRALGPWGPPGPFWAPLRCRKAQSAVYTGFDISLQYAAGMESTISSC